MGELADAQIGRGDSAESRCEPAEALAQFATAARPVAGGNRAGTDYFQCGQRRRRNFRLHAGWREIWVCLAVGPHSHDHCAVCHRRDVRAHGCGDRERALRSDSGRVRIPLDIFRDGHRFFCGLGQRGGGVCGCRRGNGNLSREQVRRRTDCGHAGVGSGDPGHLPAGGSHLSFCVRAVSVLCVFSGSG